MKIGGTIYLLQSLNGKHRYLGVTSDLQSRLIEHTRGSTQTTRDKGPWRLLQCWHFDSLQRAKQIEYKIKKMKHKLTVEYVTYIIDRLERPAE
ncbi:MAG TPA: hypothetical protein DCY48_04985 [Candidatus Magasanikbacteria bacterium]|nr:MAG: hypothetical protein A3I74_03480 [Candidatus Magasanikbacteria bacterium RIFCSPLOWO2_02_FULL_47_16]OGH80262.1 MAG: hypothetical protein A3C10_03760 [Candidatus Magasanikbacteria bacterium RIFCSPHIGHO2_02_FULL_48_18]OGH81989.1 MAG: hypothetical protein A3G08_00610 [Candidatus Magasanikbacteria bacterium RIFCSPLOWO2_12_FULL_47_9b]HAZ29094.1 hypothetical protein [Candidatus Magasanikbacteria bacterium]